MKIFELLNENDIADLDRDSIEKRLDDLRRQSDELTRKEKEIDDLITDITPGFQPIEPNAGDDQLVGYTTPRQSRDMIKNPHLYKYGTTRKKDTDFQRPMLDKNTIPPDNWKKKGMPLPNDEYPTKNIDI